MCERSTINAGSSRGTLRSQRGPNYRSNLDCTLTINVDSGRHISLSFQTVDIEGFENGCGSSDYLSIYDGSSIHSPRLAVVCGTSLPDYDVVSEGSAITLRFRTDHMVTRSGFVLTYSSIKNSKPKLKGKALDIVLGSLAGVICLLACSGYTLSRFKKEEDDSSNNLVEAESVA
ncbi:tolloid-like protein 1 [Patiria miniata]|uniref:CUB domain-containing protein n=1 Tax=Patiria miniata TaxID=46514 RepID=A0A914AUU7_PATMI|nr:tolloid-like protein 1 [Patiria miniata]